VPASFLSGTSGALSGNEPMKTMFTYEEIHLINIYLYAIFYLLVLLDLTGGFGRRG
jgi:hypothetical protein